MRFMCTTAQKGAELGMLMRRVRDRVHRSEPGRLQCIATSATLGQGKEDAHLVARFATDLFDEAFDEPGLEYFGWNIIASAVVAVVEHLADAHVAALAVAYSEAHGYSPGSAANARQAVPAGQRLHVDSVNRAWSASPTTDRCSIGLALETALVAKRLATATVDVVVTGPDSPEAPVRLTSQVVRQRIDSAERRVTRAYESRLRAHCGAAHLLDRGRSAYPAASRRADRRWLLA